MQEPHVEGVATHSGPESCAVRREAGGEALTGESAGQPLSFESHLPGADRVVLSGRPHGSARYREAHPRPAESRDPGMRGHFWRENREACGASGADVPPEPMGKAEGRNPIGSAAQVSDEGVIPTNPVKAAAEPREGRPETEGNSAHPPATGALEPDDVSCGLDRIRRAAKGNGKIRFTSLLHHVTPGLLTDAYRSLKRRAAPGVDGVTWDAYGEDLDANIEGLHQRVHAGVYRAQPSKRAWIPKSDGRMRPLGIAALEDKILQQAVGWILGAIYEQDFAGFSYGFRPGRSQHDALDALWVGITRERVNWILDADIRGFFDSLDHEWLMRFVEHRVADPRILRLLRKWLRAGVSEEGQWSKTTQGTPQGAVISPLLANLYLHHVFDLWVAWWRRHRASGDVIVVRYADDFVVGFQHRHEADSFLKDFRERLLGFALELHPEKTRLIEFGRFAASNRERRGEGRPETFGFLGFVHRCAVRRSDGSFTVARETIAKRLTAKVSEVAKQLLDDRHLPVPALGSWLASVVRGFTAYHAVPGNARATWLFPWLISKAWKRALERRSQTGKVTWERMAKLINTWLPRPTTIHPYPDQRLCVPT